MTMLLLGCFGFSLVAQTEKPVQEVIEIEEAPVFLDMEIEEEPAPAVDRSARNVPPPPPPPPAMRSDDEVFQVVEQMPQFPGCENNTDKNTQHTCAKTAMLKYIYDHPAYQAQKDKGATATAVVRFIVRKDGSIDDVKTVRAHTDDMEAVLSINSIFESMPKWNPGKQRGRTVDVYFNVPVKFN